MEERERFGGGGYQRTRDTENEKIYNYSFALQPEDYQLSSSVNLSRFKTETIQQTFTDNVDFGNKITATIPRKGDLCRNRYIKISLPELSLQNRSSIISINTTPKRYLFIDMIEIIEKEPINTFETYLKNKIYDYVYNTYNEWRINAMCCIWSTGYIFYTSLC